MAFGPWAFGKSRDARATSASFEKPSRRDGKSHAGELGEDEARRAAGCDAGEGVGERAGDRHAGLANEVDEVNQ